MILQLIESVTLFYTPGKVRVGKMFERRVKWFFLFSAVCPAGWHYYRDSCYKYYSTPKAWEDAYRYCQVHNAKLASVENEPENRYV